MPATVTIRTDYSASNFGVLQPFRKPPIKAGVFCLWPLFSMECGERTPHALAAWIVRRYVTGFTASTPRARTGSRIFGPSPTTEALAGTAAVLCRNRRDRSGSAKGRRGPLAAGRPEARDRGAVRRRLSPAHCWQDIEADWLLSHQRPPASSRPEPRDHRNVQKNFSATLNAHLAHVPKRKPIEIWFQMLCRRTRGKLKRSDSSQRSFCHADEQCLSHCLPRH